MRRTIAVVVVGMLLALTACTGLPASGPVNPGNQPRDASESQPFDLVPDPPIAGSSPQQIVDGFLRAGSGVQNDWATARLYLTPDFSKQWSPQAGVTIESPTERPAATAASPAPGATDSPDTVTITQRITAEAVVLDSGEYTPFEGNVPLEFRLVRVDGEWRIDEANDGVVLSPDVFELVYQPAAIQYFAPSWEYLVPDVRWYPRPLAATRAVQALVGGARSSWLQTSVVSAFPEGVSLVGNAVTISGGEATVELSAGVRGLEPITLDRMQTQLRQSLASVDVGSVQMTVDNTPLDAQEVSLHHARVSTSPLVKLSGGDFGFLGSETLEPVPGLSGAIASIDARAISVAADMRSAAVLTVSGAVVRVDFEGRVTSLDTTRRSLAAASIDPSGAVWSVPHDDPDAFLVFPAGSSQPISVTAPWAAASHLDAFQVSRDGTRLAALVSAHGRTEVWLAGIMRDRDGSRISLSEPQVLAAVPGNGIDLAWLDADHLGVVLTAEGSTMLLRQPVGGPGSFTKVSAAVTAIAGGNSSVRLRTSDDTLLVERGSNWEERASDVAVLVVQQGQPE